MSETTRQDDQEATGRKRQVSLKDAEKVKLWDYLRCQKERIENDRLGPTRLAAEAAEKLGMPQLNKDHLRHALRVCELPVVRDKAAGGRARGEQTRKLFARLDDLETRCGQLEQRCVRLEADNAALAKLVEETAKGLEQKWRMENGRAVPVVRAAGR